MMKLDEFIGERISLKPKVAFESGRAPKLYSVKLHGVEAGGVWIESPLLTSMLKRAAGLTAEQATRKTPIFFFPFSEIYFLVAGETQLGQLNAE